MAAGGPLYDFLFNGAHIVAYGGLATAWWYALGDADRLARTDAMRPVGTLAVALALAYGLVDELHQSFTAGRVASVGDLLSDEIVTMMQLLGRTTVPALGPDCLRLRD